MTINIVYDDKIRDATILTKGSQHPQFPAEDCQIDALLQPYRSRHGTDSGNGLFVIDANNKYIDFEEAGNGALSAELGEASYNAQSLCAEIKAEMEDVGGHTYTVTYSESTGKFMIAADGNFELQWESGAHGSGNGGENAGETLGFDESADDNGGAATYTADYVRIHWPKAFIDFDLGDEYDIDFLAVLAHNISASATLIRFTGATDSGISADLATKDLDHAAGSIHKFPTAVKRQYWRFEVHDPTNPDGYIEWGRLLVAIKWQPNRDFSVPYSRGRMDPSDRYRSDAQVLYSSEKSILKKGSLPFEGLTDANKIIAHAFMDAVGLTKGFILCFDPDNPNDDTLWVANTALNDPENRHYNYWAWMLDYMELK